MTDHFILDALFMGIGLFTAVASITNWNFFFNHRKSQLLIKLLGRNGARIFYSIIGFGFFSVGLLSALGVIVLES